MSSRETRSATTPHGDGPGAVTVRFTDSIAESDSLLATFHELDTTVAFPSLIRAYTFEDRLNRRDDARTYHLTPDHSGDATLFLRCEDRS